MNYPDKLIQIIQCVRLSNTDKDSELYDDLQYVLKNIEDFYNHGEPQLAVETLLDLASEYSIEISFKNFVELMDIAKYLGSQRYKWSDFDPIAEE